MKTKTFLKVSFSLGLLLLAACGGDDNGGPVNTPGVDAHAPVLDPIGDKWLTINEPLTINLSASDPDNDKLTFSVNHKFQSNTDNRTSDKSNFDVDAGVFTWTPQFQPLGVFRVEFIVSDTSTPPRTDSEVIDITVMETEGGKFYAWRCLECHGSAGDGQGASLPDGSDGVDMFIDNKPITLTTLQGNIDPIDGITEMKPLNELLTNDQLILIVDYANSLAPPPP